MSKSEVVGVLISDEDFERLRRDTVGKEQEVLKRVVKLTIMKAHRLKKKQKHHTRDVFFEKDDDIARTYAKVQRLIGDKPRTTLNLVSVYEVMNGYGTLEEKLKDIDKRFETWKMNNGGKI